MINLSEKLDELWADPEARILIQYFYDKGALDMRDMTFEMLMDNKDHQKVVRLVQELGTPTFEGPGHVSVCQTEKTALST